MGIICWYVAMEYMNSRVFESEVQSQAAQFEFEWKEGEITPIGTLAKCFPLVSILGMLILLAWHSIANSWLLLIHPDLNYLIPNYLLPGHPFFKYLYKVIEKQKVKKKKELIHKTCPLDLQILP